MRVWIVNPVVGGRPVPSSVRPCSSMTSRLLAVMRLKWVPLGLIRKRRPGSMTLKWLQTPSCMPRRAAIRKVAARSSRASWVSALLLGADSCSASMANSFHTIEASGNVLAEPMLHDAQAWSALEIIDQLEVARVLERREPLAQLGRERVQVDRGAGLGFHEELDVLFTDLGCHADHRAVLDPGVPGRHVLDLEGGDVLALAAYAVGHAAVEIHVPGGVERADVPAIERAVAQEGG